MIISLMNKKSITSIVLPEKIRGQYIIENSEGIKVEIEGIDEKWYIKSNKKVKLLNNEKKHTNSCEITEMAIYNLDITGSSEKTFIFAEPSTNDRVEFKKYLVRNDITINIGRNSNNDIVIDNKYVSSVHAKLTLTNAGWKIKDADSSNGTFVNGKRINESRLKFGDVIYIMGVVIIIGKNLFAINNPDQTLKIDTTLLKPYLSQCYEQNDDEFDFETIDDDTFYRSPRFKRDVEKAVFKIDAPPASQVGEEMPMMLAIGPSMTMGMASMATAVYGVAQGNMMSAVTSGCMLLGTVLWPIISKRYEKKRKRKKEELRKQKYQEYLERIRQSFEDECEKQREIILENNVSIQDCMHRIENVSRNLWERSYGQNDFLKINIGQGTVDLNADIQYPERKFEIERDVLEEELLDMCESPHIIEDVPITVSLFENHVTGVIGARNEIEIPFFVYTSRLLQSYQGGQGVLMENNGESIRFTAPGNEHDILYTMSSGQLSAVLLSFSLALNKIYSGDGIKTVLIDDPIQCMDDINMISFVELLRREFSDCQIILSTHEEEFSNFIRYKFKKYDLAAQAITLKDA